MKFSQGVDDKELVFSDLVRNDVPDQRPSPQPSPAGRGSKSKSQNIGIFPSPDCGRGLGWGFKAAIDKLDQN